MTAHSIIACIVCARRMPILLLLGLMPTPTHAFEGNEHLEIGNCAVSIVYQWLEDLRSDAKLTEEERAGFESVQYPLALFLPVNVGGVTEKDKSRRCVLPRDTGMMDTVRSLIESATNDRRPDPAGRRLIDRRALASAPVEGAQDGMSRRDTATSTPLPIEYAKVLTGPLSAGTPLLSPTYGYVTEMVDSYLSPQKLIARGSVGIDNQQWPESPEDFRQRGYFPWPEVVRALTNNDAHFGPEALLTFRELHRIAKDVARGDSDKRNIYGGLLINALADHYLQDILAPGHVMAVRQTVPEEVSIAMHDKANSVGVRFRIDRPANIESVLTYVDREFSLLYRCKPDADQEACGIVRASMRELVGILRRCENAAGQSICDVARDAFGRQTFAATAVHMRGDNHLTAKRIEDEKRKGWRQDAGYNYALVLAIEVLSVLDVISSARPDIVCTRMAIDCKQLSKGFREDVRWTSPRVIRLTDGDEIVRARPDCAGKVHVVTPKARICCGETVDVNLSDDLLDMVFAPQLNEEMHSSAKAGCGPTVVDDYKYLDYAPILAIKYQREYSRGQDLAPKVLAFELSTSLQSQTGEAMTDEREPGIGARLRSLWGLGTVGLRLGLSELGDGVNTYGVEFRGTSSMAPLPSRFFTFLRFGRAVDDQGDGKGDNSVGVGVEPFRSMLFAFGVVVGQRFPITDSSRLYYGFEVGFVWPSSRGP